MSRAFASRPLPFTAALLAASALALSFAGCKPPGAEKTEPSEEEAATRTVRVAPVARGALVETVSLVGELQGVEEVRVFAQVTERIRTLTVKEGDRVKQGDVLATVRSEMASQGVNQAQAALEAAVAQREAADDNVRRLRALAQAGSVSASQLETAESQARAAAAQVRQATAARGLSSAQKDLTTVRSPISGIVAQINVKEGDLAMPQAPVMTVVKSERMKVVLRAPERAFFRIQTGMPVRVSPLTNPKQVVDAKVTLKGPVVDRMTRTGLVEVELDNPDGTLISGTSVRAVVELSREEGKLLVPAEAILLSAETERTGQAAAFVSDGKKAARREVKVGRRQGDQLEIERGLEEGELLVVQGAHFLRDGNLIRTADQVQNDKAADSKSNAEAAKPAGEQG